MCIRDSHYTFQNKNRYKVMAVCLKADEGEHHAETRTRRKDM